MLFISFHGNSLCYVLILLAYVLIDHNNSHFSLFHKERGSPRDLITRDITDTSVGVSWTAAPGPVQNYKILWKSLYDGQSGETTVPGNVVNTVLKNLQPETKYKISVLASYRSGEGPPLEGQATTEGR